MPAKSFYRLRGGHAAIVAALALAAAPAPGAPITEAEAVDRALAQPEFTALGEANREEAQARIRGIRRFDNPEASLSREQVSGSGRSETEWQAGVTQPVDLSGRRSALRAAARAEAAAVDADIARRRQERSAEVRRAFAGCAAATEKVRVSSAFVGRLHEAERIVTARTRAGDTAGYDLRRLRVEARTAEAQGQLAAGEVAAECAALSRLSGEPDARPAEPIAAIALRATPTSPPETRPDIVAREQRVLAASQQVRAAQRARLPEIGVGLGYKRVTADEGSAGGPAISLGARIPLFDRGGAAIAEARARQRAREAELGLARREAEAAVAVAEARTDAAIAAARAAQAAAGDAARLGPIAEAAYEGGESGVVELVDAYRTARDAELEIIDLLERAARARIDLELAQGSAQNAGL
ncbi:MAG TPA: TolC family protein [Allosphingosinicella sp.]|jgi:cobalt-zinc-cadmium efflux system outer membrane protein